MGVSKWTQASDMPSMASTSCAMISGGSGLPELRVGVAVGKLGDGFAVVADAEAAIVGDDGDFGGFQAPLFEDAEDFVLAAFIGDEEHALLAFREHDFVRRHAGFALGDEIEFDLDAD